MKKYLKLFLFAAVGAVLGYAYYYFVGCTNDGGCPLTSKWYITTGYGFASGILMALPNKKRQEAGQNSEGKRN